VISNPPTPPLSWLRGVAPSNTLILVPLPAKDAILPELSAAKVCDSFDNTIVIASEPSSTLTIVISSENEPAVAVNVTAVLAPKFVEVIVAVSPLLPVVTVGELTNEVVYLYFVYLQ
jgi:hypothetical protein